MPNFNSSPITEIPAVRPSPMEGSGIVPTTEIIDNLTQRSEWSPEARDMIGLLLSESGVIVDIPSTGAKLDDDEKLLLHQSIEAKKQPVQEVYDLANELLPSLKEDLTSGLSSYAEQLGIDPSKVKETVSKRIVNVAEVKVDDPLTQNSAHARVRTAAHFDNHDDTLRIASNKVVKNAEALGLSQREQIVRDVTHELLHAGSFRAESEGLNYTTRAGLGAMEQFGDETPIRAWTGAILLDEGAQEDIRWRHLDGSVPGYEKSVMFWEAAIALDPSLEVDRFNAKFFNKDRGAMVGKIENIFGPGAVEHIEESLGDYPNVSDYPEWKDHIISMIDVYDADPNLRNTKTEAARLKARQVLDSVQSEIFKSRGADWDLSDEEWRKYKQAKLSNNVSK